MNGLSKAANFLFIMLLLQKIVCMCGMHRSSISMIHNTTQNTSIQYSSFSYTFLNVCVHLCLLFLIFSSKFLPKFLIKNLN